MRSSPLLLVFTIAESGVSSGILLASEASHGAARWWLNTLWWATALLWLGFLGTQRVWLQRAFRAEKLGVDEAISLTLRFVRRFVELALLVSIPLVPVAIVVTSIDPDSRPSLLLLAAYVLILDATLTFVVPALALTTRSPLQALRIGRQMIAATWPSCAWYLFLPGLTFALLLFVVPDSPSLMGLRLLGALFFPVVALWFKGAIVAFYLRHMPTSIDPVTNAVVA